MLHFYGRIMCVFFAFVCSTGIPLYVSVKTESLLQTHAAPSGLIGVSRCLNGRGHTLSESLYMTGGESEREISYFATVQPLHISKIKICCFQLVAPRPLQRCSYSIFLDNNSERRQSAGGAQARFVPAYSMLRCSY